MPETNAVRSFSQAVALINQLKARDTADIHPACRLRFLHHGDQADQAVILWHGYTDSPHQLYPLGKRLHKLGYNVLIPRMQYHGFRDRLNPQHARLTADDLKAAVTEAVDIAQGLGKEVHVMGLSMGGVMAAWAAQNRADVDRAVIISPAMGVHAVPHVFTRLAMWITKMRSNRFGWWDPDLKDAGPYPPYAYPQYATQTIAQLVMLGFQIRKQARKTLPAAKSIFVVTNVNDQAVNNKAVQSLVRQWRKNGATNIRTCEFTASQQLSHDFIDPEKHDNRPELVYPVLLDLVSH
ncbi:MAG: alpha/beta fold hydrolase [Chloroflexota bacterium]